MIERLLVFAAVTGNKSSSEPGLASSLHLLKWPILKEDAARMYDTAISLRTTPSSFRLFSFSAPSVAHR